MRNNQCISISVIGCTTFPLYIYNQYIRVWSEDELGGETDDEGGLDREDIELKGDDGSKSLKIFTFGGRGRKSKSSSIPC